MQRTIRALMAVALFGGAMALAVSPASAAPFAEGSFEMPDLGASAFVNVPAGGTFGPWSVVRGSVNFLNSPTFVASDGDQTANLSGTSPALPAAATAGGVAQSFDLFGGGQYQLQYDWTSKCAGSNVRVSIDNGVIDSATNAAATYPTYSTRTLPFQPLSNTMVLQFDTTTTGPRDASICGTIIDNVRVTRAAVPTLAASPATQCAGPTGHRVQFRKVSFGVGNFSDAKSAFNRPVTDPAVVAQATHNGVPYINYDDVPTGNQFPARPAFDVGEPPLTHVAGAGTFAAGAIDFNYVMRSTGYINIPVAGLWTFNNNSDDGHRLVMGANGVLIHTTALGPSSTLVSVPAPGCYHYALEFYQIPAGGSFVTFTASGPGQVGTQLVGDTPANGGTSTLAVYQGTDTPSTCKITAARKAPNSINGVNDDMDVTIADSDGLGGVYNIQATNASVGAVPAGWLPGLNGPLVVRATKITQGSPAAFSFTMSDFNGVEKLCT